MMMKETGAAAVDMEILAFRSRIAAEIWVGRAEPFTEIVDMP